MIFCAPHANSYHRFEENSYAPINATWGKDNRTTALRIPSGNEDSTRIEHRLSGADANPYLVMAMLISGFLHGFEEDPEIPPETIGNGYEDGSRPLPQSWKQPSIYSKTKADFHPSLVKNSARSTRN